MRVNEVSLRLYLEDLTKISITMINRVKDGTAYAALQPLLDTTILDKQAAFPNNCQVMVSELLNLKRTTNSDSLSRTYEKHAFESVPHIVRCVISIANAGVKKKYDWVVRDATTSLYYITTTLLGEKYLLELNVQKFIQKNG